MFGCSHANRSHFCHLGDFFGRIFLKYFWEKSSKKIVNFKIKILLFLLSFLFKTFQKYVIFKVFQVHLLFKSNGYMNITLLLKVQMLMK